MDYGHEYADAQLEKLEKRLAREYRQAFKTSRDMAREYFEQFDKEDKKMFGKLNAGQITEKEYLRWRQIEMATGERYNNMRDALAKEYNNVNKIAASMINDDVKDAFAENFNYGTYEIETGARVNTNFTIYNKDAVEAIVKDEPDLLPKARVDIPKDLRWNKSKINSAIVQGILTGQSVDKIADNLQSVTNMNRNTAIRNARTMNNSARNLGRQKSYERGMAMGIKSRKMWLATPDGRTRHSHRITDNEIVAVTEKFSNGLMYPSDKNGSYAEVCNCRCRMINIPDGIDPKLFQEDKISAYMTRNNLTYEEWKHEREPKPKPVASFGDLVKPQRPSRDDFANDELYQSARALYRADRKAYAEKKDAIIEKMMPKNSVSVEDFTKWAESHGMKIHGDISQVDDKALSLLQTRMTKLANDFPDVVNFRQRYTDIPEEYRFFEIAHEHTMDFVAEANHGFKFGSDGEDVLALLNGQAEDVASGFRVKGDGTINQLFDHEFGHNVYDSLKNIEDRSEAGFQRRRNLEDDLLKNVFGKSGASEYSSTNYDELFAEAFSAWYGGEDTEFANAMGDFLRRWNVV